MKTLRTLLFIFAAGMLAVPVYADIVTTTTTVTTTIRSDAPIYTGPVVEAQLEPLTLGDFQKLVTKPMAAWTEFRDYQKSLENPESGAVLYKMRVTDDLTLADFQGPNVSPEVAQARYNAYLAAKPKTADEVSYVYVYHKPVVKVAV